MWPFSRKKKKPKLGFGSWFIQRMIDSGNLHESLEDTLNAYIAYMGGPIKLSLDEPEKVSIARTKLQLIADHFKDAKDAKDKEKMFFYVSGLRTLVEGWDEGSENMREELRARLS